MHRVSSSLSSTPSTPSAPDHSVVQSVFSAIQGSGGCAHFLRDTRPVGLLYASVSGGVAMILAALIVVRIQFYVFLVLIWLVSCVWGVVATNRYNEKIHADYLARFTTGPIAKP